MGEAHNSQEIFFNRITRNKLNELLNRVSTGYLEEQINNLLNGYISVVSLSNDCMNVYINFSNRNGENIGHISFHLNKENKNMNNISLRKGRLHIINNRNRNKYYTIRVHNKSESISMTVESPLKMNRELSECVKISMKIINQYLTKESKYYLKYKLTKSENRENKCLIKIAGPIERSRFRNTEKQSKTKISIPKGSLYSWKKRANV
jgi:hypothetical protein